MVQKGGEWKISENRSYLEGKNIEIEFFMDCLLCGERAIQYFMDFGRRQIRFYVNYYLLDENVNYLLKKRTIHHEEKYDVELRCPVYARAEGLMSLEWTFSAHAFDNRMPRDVTRLWP